MTSTTGNRNDSSTVHASIPTRGQLIVDGHEVSWLRDGDLDGPILLLAHGAGAPCSHPFMQSTAQSLRDRGVGVVRWNFPYMETNFRQRARRPPDREPLLLATYRAVIDCVHSWRPRARLVIGGKSMGGRMASQLLASEPTTRAAGAVYLGYPLIAAGRPDRERSAHLPGVQVRQLFVTGTRDPLCPLDRLRKVLDPLSPRARLHVVEGGDHSLTVRGSRAAELRDAWLDAVATFVRSEGESGVPNGI